MSAILDNTVDFIPDNTHRELLLGCGMNRDRKVQFAGIPDKWTGLVTLDMNPDVDPDVVWDLNRLPLPFPDDHFDAIFAFEVLEHTGQQGDWKFFLAQFEDLWRILKPDGYLIATVPLWDSKWAWGDPGHTRVINEGSLIFLNQDEYARQCGKTSMTDYRPWYKGNFRPVHLRDEGETFGFVLQAIK
jgi:SAM-dependent methyltransferase